MGDKFHARGNHQIVKASADKELGLLGHQENRLRHRVCFFLLGGVGVSHLFVCFFLLLFYLKGVCGDVIRYYGSFKRCPGGF